MDETVRPNARDRVWSTALRVAFTQYEDEFTTGEVFEEADELSGTHDQIIRRTLRAMVQLGWLEKVDSERSETRRLKDRPPWADDSAPNT